MKGEKEGTNSTLGYNFNLYNFLWTAFLLYTFDNTQRILNNNTWNISTPPINATLPEAHSLERGHAAGRVPVFRVEITPGFSKNIGKI